jgi:branched-chain amino acid transport system ATP-binding protein
MLRVEEVSVNFGGVRALDEVSLEVDAAQLAGLIGPNGAGKTTLFNVVTGLQKPSHGSVHIEGRNVTESSPRARAGMGLGRTFQRLELFGSLSTHDNVLTALEGRGIRGRTARGKTADLLERLGLSHVAATPANVLPTGLARLLELARALACSPKVLLLDEPSSGLDAIESERLATLLQELAHDGIAVVLVEHDMEFVMGLCTHIHVLDFGRLIATGDPAAIQANPEVQAAYLGAPTGVGGDS